MAGTADRYSSLLGGADTQQVAAGRPWSKGERRLAFVAVSCLALVAIVAISMSSSTTQITGVADSTNLLGMTRNYFGMKKSTGAVAFPQAPQATSSSSSPLIGYRPQSRSETAYTPTSWAGSRPLFDPIQNFRGSGATTRIVASAKLGDIYQKLSDPRPVQIIPSVLPADWAAMGQCVKDLEAAGVDRIQFDVMDGNFVPNLTFGPEMIAACRKNCKTPFETQLMVTNYNSDTMLEEYVEATKGPNGEPGVVIVHVEACTHLHRTLGRIRALGGSPSVALNPHTPSEMVMNVLDMVDHVLVMTVNPGFGGQAYIPTMLNKIQELRAAIVEGGYDVDIEVDGGVKADWTISQCAAAGANCFIAGSGMFAYPTLKEGCDALRKVAQDAMAGNVLPAPK